MPLDGDDSPAGASGKVLPLCRRTQSPSSPTSSTPLTPAQKRERAYSLATFGTWIAAINNQHRTTGHLSPPHTSTSPRPCLASAGSLPRRGTGRVHLWTRF